MFDGPAVAAVLVLGTLYVRAARRRDWPPGRTTAFLAGLATIVLVTCSPLAFYDRTFFWVRAVQTITLLMITPLLLAMGAPIRLLLDSFPRAATSFPSVLDLLNQLSARPSAQSSTSRSCTIFGDSTPPDSATRSNAAITKEHAIAADQSGPSRPATE